MQGISNSEALHERTSLKRGEAREMKDGKPFGLSRNARKLRPPKKGGKVVSK